MVRESSKIQIQVLDQPKFKRNDQGFLGSVTITVGDVLNLNQGGSGTPAPPLPLQSFPSFICIILALVIQNLEPQPA